jgi:antitoxin component of MazEF toxin-antitoxin module
VALTTVGKWGKESGLTRFPGEIAKAAGLSDRKRVEIEAREGTLLIRRTVV